MTKRVRKVFKRADKVFDWSGSVQSKDGRHKELRYTVDAIGKVEQSLNSFIRSVIEKIVKENKEPHEYEVSESDVKGVVSQFPEAWFNRNTDLLDGCSSPREMIERLSQSYVAEVDTDFDEGEDPVEADNSPKKKLNLSLSKRQVCEGDFEGAKFTDSFVMGFSRNIYDAPLPSVGTLLTPPQDVDSEDLIAGLFSTCPGAPIKQAGSYIKGLSPIRQDVAKKSKQKNLIKRKKKADMPAI